jgi:hypothetical protein
VVGTVANEATVVAGFNAANDDVLFTYDSGSGVRTLCAFDTRRDAFASGDGDIGLVINCAGVVEPIAKSTVTPPSPPTAPTIVSTSDIATTQAQTNWTVGDALAKTEVTYRVQGNPAYSLGTLADLGATTFTLTGLSSGTAYEWRLRAYKNGVYSSYVGPVAASQFTTAASGGGGTGPASPSGLGATVLGATSVTLTWTNGDGTVPTQVFRSTDGVSFSQVGTAPAGDTTYLDNTHAHGDFSYEVRHIDGSGNPSGYSNVTPVTV